IATQDPVLTARLEFEIARLMECALADPRGAIDHYRAAVFANRDHLPAVTGIRRCAMLLGDHGVAHEYLNEELRLANSPRRKAAISYVKASLLAATGRTAEAQVAHREGLAFDRDFEPSLRLTVAEEMRAGRWHEAS